MAKRNEMAASIIISAKAKMKMAIRNENKENNGVAKINENNGVMSIV